MFGVIVSVVQLIAVVNAFVRSVQERFIVGIACGSIRALLLVASAFGALSARPSLALAGVALGPIVSFAALYIAYRRKKDAPAAQEERLGRPFVAWLPVTLFDAASIAINLFGWVIASNAY
jgi:hypothetical protein